ncbi:MAG: N5-glutamine methyltransferase family protein [Ruminiclostridium sp.]
MNIKEYLRYAANSLKVANIETPVLEAGVILCHILKCDKVYLYSQEDRVLQKEEIGALNYILRQRSEHVPLQYLMGETEFMSLSFTVSPAVLIPRQDTELLVEKCIELINEMSISRRKQVPSTRVNAKGNALEDEDSDADRISISNRDQNTDIDLISNRDQNTDIDLISNRNQNTDINLISNCDHIEISILADKSKVKVLDMCTGSGCVAISIAHYCPDSIVVACDVSRDALSIAKVNSERNGVQNRLELRWGDLFEALAGERGFDIIVSNPPYIETSIMPSLQEEVINHEPHLALDGGLDGLDFYRDITSIAPDYLINGGYLAFEIGYNQGQSVSDLMKESFNDIEVYKDLAGNDRVVIGRFVK